MAVILAGISAMGRTGIAGQALGIAQGSYDVALGYAKERKLYGKTIAELQAVQHMLVESNLELEAARLLSYKAVSQMDMGKSPREASDDIARAKLFTCEIANRITLRAIQVLGGYGTVPQYQLVRRLNDSLSMFAATGTQEIMKNMLARSILS